MTLREKNGQKRMTVVFIIAIPVVTALLVILLYHLKKEGADEKAAIPEADAGTADTEYTLPTEADIDADMIDFDAALSADKEAHKRPDAWYGAYESSGPVEKAVDLETFIKRCPDVYAFIDIPGTRIAQPIAYCEDAVDPYWFTHDIDGNPSDKGMIITDALNATDMSDPVTLIYGQAPADGSMFADLSAFRNADFFEGHEWINIQLMDARLMYRIYCCYTGSNENILAENDFNDPAVFTDFFGSVKDVRDLAMNIREDAAPSLGDHVIGLVTHCDDESKRLFVFAVLEQVRY